MSFVEMTNEDWEEVRRLHDAFVQTGELELRTEEIGGSRGAGTAQYAMKPVELQLRELDDVFANIQH
ncbi:MAG: hypothetical protein ACREPK_10160 [Rhodanobacteraceae bacterium]